MDPRPEKKKTLFRTTKRGKAEQHESEKPNEKANEKRLAEAHKYFDQVRALDQEHYELKPRPKQVLPLTKFLGVKFRPTSTVIVPTEAPKFTPEVRERLKRLNSVPASQLASDEGKQMGYGPSSVVQRQQSQQQGLTLPKYDDAPLERSFGEDRYPAALRTHCSNENTVKLVVQLEDFLNEEDIIDMFAATCSISPDVIDVQVEGKEGNVTCVFTAPAEVGDFFEGVSVLRIFSGRSAKIVAVIELPEHLPVCLVAESVAEILAVDLKDIAVIAHPDSRGNARYAIDIHETAAPEGTSVAGIFVFLFVSFLCFFLVSEESRFHLRKRYCANGHRQVRDPDRYRTVEAESECLRC
jgi:hypothetical protein